jgi:hypothetical protein
MSEWLERELARGLAPVAAPESLGIRLGFARTRAGRWVLPRVAIALAAAVMVLIGGGYAASRTPAPELRGAVRPGECVRAATLQVNGGNATVLLAHESVASPKTPEHSLSAASDAGCHQCHTL